MRFIEFRFPDRVVLLHPDQIRRIEVSPSTKEDDVVVTVAQVIGDDLTVQMTRKAYGELRKRIT